MECMLHAIWLMTIFSTFLRPVSAQLGPDPRWLKPNGSNVEFAETYTNGDSITLSWLRLNHSISDLWLTRFDPSDTYALLLKAGENIAVRATYKWTINLKAATIDQDNQFCLRFVPNGIDYYPSQFQQFVSPGFKIRKRPSTDADESVSTTKSHTSTTSSTTTPFITSFSSVTEFQATATSETSSTATSTTATSTASPDIATESTSSTALSAGAAAGIGVGVTIVVAALVASGWFVGRRRNSKADSNVTDKKPIIPLAAAEHSVEQPIYRSNSTTKSPIDAHEVVGSYRQPTEMNTRNSHHEWHELE